jgi:hypothetical protein
VLAAEFYGQVVVESGCLLVDFLLDNREDTRATMAVLFPFGTHWSAADDGLMLPNGVIAPLGSYLHGGGGGRPLKNLDSLTRLDDGAGQTLRDCAAASDDPSVYWETAPEMKFDVMEVLPDEV